MSGPANWSHSRLWSGVHLTWDVWYRCNYRCSYCWFEMDQVWEKLAKEHEGIGARKWIEAWKRIHDLHGEVSVDVLGGEPLLYPEAEDLFAAMARWHRLFIISNLSISLDALKLLTDSIPPERLYLSASYHHESSRWEEFFPKAAFLKERGYDPEVTMVAWPPLLGAVEQKRRMLDGAGIKTAIRVFQGTYAGRDYPRSYTEAERAVLGDLVPQEDDRKYRMHEAKTLGRICGAGHVYANMKANGDVYRCGKDSMFSKPLGNVFDPAFRLFGAPAPCPYNFCNACGEHVYLWEDWTREAAARKARESASVPVRAG